VISLKKNRDGIFCYSLAVRSLEGSGGQARGVALEAPAGSRVERPNTAVGFTLTNTGQTAGVADPAAGEEAAAAEAGGSHLNCDVYRLSVTVESKGWTARLLNALAAVKIGESQPIQVYISYEEGSVRSATVTLRAASESDPSKTATAGVKLSR
jgi:hypothetical protein